MRYMLSWSFAVLAALSVVGCATVPTAKTVAIAQTAGKRTCRVLLRAPVTEADVFVPKGKKNHILCADAKQWTEFDRRAALIGVTCRGGWNGAHLCMNSEQWKDYDRMVQNRRDTSMMGQEAAASAAQIAFANAPFARMHP